MEKLREYAQRRLDEAVRQDEDAGSSSILTFLFPMAGRSHARSATHPAKAARGQRGEKDPVPLQIGHPRATRPGGVFCQSQLLFAWV